LAVVIAISSMGVELTPVPQVARLVVGFLLALVLPGYGITSILLKSRTLGLWERLLCVLGFSLVVSILGGLLLNFMPGHLDRSAWAVFDGGFALVCFILASLKTPKWPNTDSESFILGTGSGANDSVSSMEDKSADSLSLRAYRPSLLTVLLITATLTVTGGALAISVHASQAQRAPLTMWLRPLSNRHLEVGVSPGTTAQTGLTLVTHEGSKVSRLSLPTLSPTHTFTMIIQVPTNESEIMVELEYNSKSLRNVQYWYPKTQHND
jgi:hypothetical protein